MSWLELLLVASDRVSAYDFALEPPIPGKGELLTRLSRHWFDRLAAVPNHLIPDGSGGTPVPESVAARSMHVLPLDMFPVECVVRGYLVGSGWAEYRESGSVCGVPLPDGLSEGDRLPEPIYTPAYKAPQGEHDENISFAEMEQRIGAELANKIRDVSIQLYTAAADYAATRGIIIADTKFEFGFVNGELVLADEVLTPDSSRFWPKDQYRPGGAQPSFDKQYVRDYLEEIRWNKHPPAPALPPEVAARTSEKYRDAYRLLTGRSL